MLYLLISGYTIQTVQPLHYYKEVILRKVNINEMNKNQKHENKIEIVL